MRPCPPLHHGVQVDYLSADNITVMDVSITSLDPNNFVVRDSATNHMVLSDGEQYSLY